MTTERLDAVSISDLTLDYILDADGVAHLGLPGGKAVYTAVGLWLWGVAVGLAVDAGWDFPDDRLEPFRRAGIDVRGVQRNPDYTTTRWAVRYRADGERTPWNPYRHYATAGSPPVPLEMLPDVEGFSPADVVAAHEVDLPCLPPDYHQARGYHFAGREFHRFPDVVRSWAERGALLTLDADWYTGPRLALDGPSAVIAEALRPLELFTAVLPSEVDVFRLFGPGTDLHRAARRLARAGPACVAIKLGRRGSLLYRRDLDRFDHIPIYPTHTVDPTGAGDAYAGGFLAGLLRTGDPLEAAGYGTVSASFIVEGYGTAHALHVDRREPSRRLAWLRRQGT